MTTALRSATVVIAVTFQRLLEDASREWLLEEDLVLQALRISSPTKLANANADELAEYLRGMSSDPQRVGGLLSAVKGKYHELLLAREENSDGDEVSADLAEELNTPGYDIEFFVDGHVIDRVQVKAVSSREQVLEHLEKYPDIDIQVTEEVARMFEEERVTGSGFSNEEIEKHVVDRLEELQGDGLIEEITEGLATSALVIAAIMAGKVVRGELSASDIRSLVTNIGAGFTTAILLDILLSL